MSESGEETSEENQYSPLEALRSEIAKLQFCCGGSIPISTEPKKVDRYGSWDPKSKYSLASPPVTIRWDHSKGVSKVTLPTTQGSEGLNQLERGSKHATNEDPSSLVSDELEAILRKNFGSLGTSAFSTTFNPYDFGIVETIKTALLPEFGRIWEAAGIPGEGERETWGVVAELHNLNFYTREAPPNSALTNSEVLESTEFGNLIVSLPSSSEGAHLTTLTVVHKDDPDHPSSVDRRHEFKLGSERRGDDHSSKQPASIRWAAFYKSMLPNVAKNTTFSFCQAESGSVITLNYKLFISTPLTTTMPLYKTIDPFHFPFFSKLKSCLENTAFMPDGGKLGFYCTHRYGHTGDLANDRFPHIFKGIDFMVYSTFKRLELNVDVRQTLVSNLREDEPLWREEEVIDEVDAEEANGDLEDEEDLGEEYITGTRTLKYFISPVPVIQKTIDGHWPPKTSEFLEYIKQKSAIEVVHSYEELNTLNDKTLEEAAVCVFNSQEGKAVVATDSSYVIIFATVPSYDARKNWREEEGVQRAAVQEIERTGQQEQIHEEETDDGDVRQDAPKPRFRQMIDALRMWLRYGCF